MCHLTDHAVQRTKERIGLPKRSAEKNAQKALENGIRHCETKGSLNRYITALYWKHTTHDIAYQYNGYWEDAGGSLGPKARVFAWMPLPEPPKGENDG